MLVRARHNISINRSQLSLSECKRQTDKSGRFLCWFVQGTISVSIGVNWACRSARDGEAAQDRVQLTASVLKVFKQRIDIRRALSETRQPCTVGLQNLGLELRDACIVLVHKPLLFVEVLEYRMQRDKTLDLAKRPVAASIHRDPLEVLLVHRMPFKGREADDLHNHKGLPWNVVADRLHEFDETTRAVHELDLGPHRDKFFLHAFLADREHTGRAVKRGVGEEILLSWYFID